MATISIADNDARVQYTQAVTADTTQLTIDFPFFALDDIQVIVTTSAGVDSTLTRGTGAGTFAVTGTSVDDGFSGGHITLGDTYSDSSTKYTIFRSITVARTTDFPSSGPFNITSLNTELDKIFAIEQELQTKLNRTMKLADSDTAATLSLPNVDTRKGTVLAFNTVTGLPEAGPEIGDVSTIASITADIGTLADIEDGTDATDAIQTVAGISSNVSAVSGISANVTTVAGISSNVTTVAGISANVTTVASDSADIQALAPYTAELGRLGTADAVSDLNTLATSAIVNDLDALADLAVEIDALGDITANINTVAGISANVTTVAGDSADIQTVASNIATISTKANAGANSDITSLSGITGNINLPDNSKAQFGTDNDFEVFHNGSNTILQNTGTGEVYIGASGTQIWDETFGEACAKFFSDSDVELYHDGSKKFETSSTGVTVTGTAIATTNTDTTNTGSVTLDFGANQNFVLTLTGNVTLANPSTEQVGQSGFIAFIQDSTGGRTLSLGTDYETAGGAGITLSTAASTTDLVPYVVVASNRILLGAPQLAFS